MTSQAETLFSCRIVSTDYYLAPPVKHLDVCYSDLTSIAVERVPVIRIFGATPAGQKCCVHVHGVFPYIHVPCPNRVPSDRCYLQQLANSIDSALHLSAGHVSSHQKFNYVYKIIVVKGIPFYGYHKHEELFLRIYLYNPAVVTRLADLLTAGAVMQQIFQSHDAHIPFVLQFFIDFHLYGMNFINFETVKFRIESSSEATSTTRSVSKVAPESCEPDARLLSTSSSSSRSCDLVATPSQKHWSMQDIECEMMSNLSKVSLCELECDGLAVHITNKTNKPTTEFSDNPGIAALWHDEKVRREWKGLVEDLVALPSPVRDPPVQCFAAERQHKETLHQIIQDSYTANSTPEDISDPSLDSLMMSQSCDLTAHVMAGDASQQEQQQQPVTMDTTELVVDVEIVEQLTQLSQQLSSSAIGQCSDQELLELLRQLAQTSGDDNISTQNNIASQVIRNSQGISPSMISSLSHVSLHSSPLDIAILHEETDNDTLTPPEGGNDDTFTPPREANDVTPTQMGENPHSQAPSYQSDSILFQDSPHSVGGALKEGGADDTVILTAEQRAQVINLCSHGNEEDLQLDNTYHCSLDELDITMMDDDVIECENDVMSQPWSSEHHLEQQQKEYCSEDIPDIEDIWTSSFIDQIPQLDGAGDKDPPPKKCYGLRQRQHKKYYEDKVRPRSHSIWKPFKPPARRQRSCDSQSASCDQSRSCDHQDESSITQRSDSLRILTLTKSLFPYVKKLSSKEISSIKDGLQHKQDSPLQQVGVADQTYAPKQPSDHLDHQTKADDQIHEDTTVTSKQSSDYLDHQTKADDQDTTIKKRPSLSLKRRKKKQDGQSDQKSPFKKRKFSPVKKLNISGNEQDLIKSLQCSQEMEDAMPSTLDVPSTLRYHQLQFVTEEYSTSNDSQPHGDDDDDNNFDALHNMGYLSPMIDANVVTDYCPDQSSSLLLSPFKCCSPTPSSSDSQLNTSFSLVLHGSSTDGSNTDSSSSDSNSSTPEHSSSSHTDGSPSPFPSPTSFGNVVNEDLVFGDCQVQYDVVVTSVGSHDQDKGSCDHVVETPPGGSDDAISYISESPRSKLSDSVIPVDTDNTCIITPALAPPTSSHLLDTLDHYGISHVVHEQPFCSDPQDVPPAKHIGSRTIKIPSKMVYELPEFQPVYTSGCGSFASTGIMHWRTILSMLSSSSEEPPPPSSGNCISVEQYESEGKWRVSSCPDKYCTITPAKLPPCPKKLLSDVEGVSSRHSNQIHTSTPKVVKKVTKEQPVSLTPIKAPPVTQRKISTGSQSLDHSELSGPTLRNSYDFKISPEMGDHFAGSDHHKVQYLTVFSVELHISTRGGLNPDPQFDAVMAICYHVNNDWSPSNSDTMATTHQYTGVIVVTPTTASDSCNKQDSIQSDFLSLSGLPTELDISYVDSEEALLAKLVELVRRYDADILIGYEVQMSSWGYLVERAAALNINLTGQLSRIQVGDDHKEYKHRNSSETSPAAEYAKRYSTELNVIGRIILNIWRIMQHEVALTSYTFENVFYHVLHQRTAKYSFQTLTRWYSKFEPLYCGRVIQYYLLRCMTNYDLLEKFNLIGRTSEFARLYGILFYSVLSRGTQFRVESMLFRLAKPRNFIAVSPSVRQRAQMAAPESLPLILEPESRFYADPVVVLDFQSLYPSIVIGYNYCFSTCLGRVHYLEQNDCFPFGATNLNIPRKTLKELVSKDLVTVSPNGVVFVKDHVRRGIMPRMLEEILNTRVMVKKSMKLHKDDKTLGYILDARQLGLKLIANVTFGYTAASFSGRMPCVEISDSIISKARETLNRAIVLVNNTPRWGGRVVYGDTDSLFVLLKGATKEEAFRIGKEIVEAVTADNPKPVKLKFEKVYLPCVLQTKKRYVGYAYESEEQKEPIFDAKGIETVRRDGCPAVVKILERSIKLLFDTKDISKVKGYVMRQCGRVLNGRVSIREYTFAREYRGKSGYRPGACVPALELAREHLAVDPRSEPLVAERVPYVIIYGPPGLPLIRLVKKPMDLLLNPTLRLNGEYYVTKQILPALDRVFSLVGVDVTKWYYELPRVFRVTKPPSTISKGTIGQYFATIHCVVCGRLSVNTVCSSCTADSQKVATVMNSRIQSSEVSYHQLLLACSHCVDSKDEQHIDGCVSFECPVLSRRLNAKHKLQTSEEMRDLLNKLPS